MTEKSHSGEHTATTRKATITEPMPSSSSSSSFSSPAFPASRTPSGGSASGGGAAAAAAALASHAPAPTLLSTPTAAANGAAGPTSASPTSSAHHYQVQPGKGLGIFTLGMPLGLAIKRLSDHYTLFRDVSLSYHASNPLALDIVLHIASEGLHLRFEPRSQRLKFIDVYDPRRISLLYDGQPICPPGSSPTYAQLYHLFGIARGQYFSVKKMYLLRYPGLSLWFPVTPDREVRGEVELTPSFTFQDGAAPLLSNLCIYCGSDSESPELPPLADLALIAGCSPLYYQEVLVTKDLDLDLPSLRKKLRLGDCAQDVLAELGAPDDVYYKSEDKMRIHARRRVELPCADYFYNYFSLGIDVLFDAHSHTAKKFILHTNIPGHFDFNRYSKCNYRIQIMGHGVFSPPSSSSASSSSSLPPAPPSLVPLPSPFAGASMAASVVDTQPGPLSFDEQLTTVDLSDRPIQPQHTIGADSKWSEIQALLPPLGESVPFTRPPTANTVDPFGATALYCVNNSLIFEVLPNGYVATVTIFQAGP